jgi:ATP-dependent DNA ligase
MSTHDFSTIYGRDKHDKIKIWKAAVHVDPSTGKAIATIEHGYMDGKLQTTTREYTEGKNIGKKNETSPLQQCIQETARKHQDKIEKEGYTESLDQPTTNPTTTVYPMLAQKYDPKTNSAKKKSIDFPCFVQPKLDGLRCIVYLDANQKLKFQSRTGSDFVGLAHIERALIPLFSQDPTLILDGDCFL